MTSDTWCKFQRDVIENTNTYSNKSCLPYIFRNELKPIFDRLSSRELLSGCEQGLTQNANESINGMVWTRCPKRLFRGRRRYNISVCDSVTQFNEGGYGRKRLFKLLKLDVGLHCLKGLQQQDKVRLNRAAYGVTEKYKKRRQTLRQLRKTKKKKTADKSYIPAGFTTQSFPDCDFHVENRVIITFVSDSDVVEHIVAKRDRV